MSTVHFDILHPGRPREQLTVDGGRVLIGSAAHCEIRLPPETCEAEHVLVEVVGNTLTFEARGQEPPALLDGHLLTRESRVGEATLTVGPITLRAVSGGLGKEVPLPVTPKQDRGSVLIRVLGLTLLPVLAYYVLFVDGPALGAPPAELPELWAAAGAGPRDCPGTSKEQAAAMARDKRLLADGRRERHPFSLADGVESVALYELSATCHRAAGEAADADDAALVARQLRSSIDDEVRVRRLRLERALQADDREVSAREVLTLRALVAGKDSAYGDWLRVVARRLDLDKEGQ